MHPLSESPAQAVAADGQPWWRELNRYHWFVFVVASLGWLFDTMDQQLFNIARRPAMLRLLEEEPGVLPTSEQVAEYSGYATSIFLIGWGVGGLFFGVLGDLLGRVKALALTILLYSVFTGLSAVSVGWKTFALYRFLTGLGVGGEFAVGISLVAEVMPDRARPFALGMLQALSAVGNITAAVVSINLAFLARAGYIKESWRAMFIIGALPALLTALIIGRLKEPERWNRLAGERGIGERLGSYFREIFENPRWTRNAVVGLLLASSGIIGLWGIGFFSIDLQREVFSKRFAREGLPTQEVTFQENLWAGLTSALVSVCAFFALYAMGRSLARVRRVPALALSLLLAAAGGAVCYWYLQGIFHVPIQSVAKEITFQVDLWAGWTSVMLNLGAFFGIYAFSRITHHIGRRSAFAVSFVLALLSTAFVFWNLRTAQDIFWMVPVMGFCQLALFGGYAIYFPELFPTRLRSTGTSICYNGARFVGAAGPTALGLLTSRVFAGYQDPVRYAGVAMCSVFLIGLLVLPFAPETKGQPLPE